MAIGAADGAKDERERYRHAIAEAEQAETADQAADAAASAERQQKNVVRLSRTSSPTPEPSWPPPGSTRARP